MEINMELEKLKQRAERIGRYYCKGFGDCLGGVNGGLEAYLKHPEELKHRDNGYRWLGKIFDFYSKIPFDELKNDEVFFPLFVVKRMLDVYKGKIDQVIETKNDKLFKDVANYSDSITEVGNLYRYSFRDALRDVREASGNDDFKVRVVDLEGEIWDLTHI